MVRTIKAKATRALKKGEQAILLPGNTGAEPWELWVLDGGGNSECIQTCLQPTDNRLRQSTTLALPVAQVFCLPLWLNQTDPKLLRDMIPLQLELRGLQPRAQEQAVFDWSVAAQEAGRMLLTVGVLPANLPHNIETEAYHAFDLSARYFPLEENAVTLWLEQDQIACAITRGRELVYFQSFQESRITIGVLRDLICVRASLSNQDVLQRLDQIVVWMDATEAELGSLQDALQTRVVVADRPSPRLPAQGWKLVPWAVSHARESRYRRRWQGRAAVVAFILYLAFIAWMISRVFVLDGRVKELRSWQAQQAPALALVHETEAAWKDLRPVVDAKSYPLELLLHCAEALPADQLHLTLFEAEDGHLLIKGEAKNVSAAFAFLDRLKRDPYLSGYTWDMGQPQILPNDLAQLQIEGTRSATPF